VGTLRGVTGRARTALIGIVVLAAALRFPTLGEQSFWADEAATADVLRHGFGDLFAAVRDQESTPPLYYVLAKLWTVVLGDDDAATRSFSAVCGTATVPLAGLLAVRVGGSERAGLGAALLVATSPLLIWFSQEARAYALLVLLSALSLLLLLRALDEPSPRRLVAWGVVVALALATHFFALFLVTGEALWLLFALRDRRRGLYALAVPSVAGLALLPLALDQREAGRAGFIGEDSLGHRVLQVLKQFLVGDDAPGEVVLTAIAAAVVVVAIVGVWRSGAAGRGTMTRIVALVTAVSVVVPLALALVGEDYVITRNLLATLVPVLVLVAVGLAALPPRAGTAGLAVVALVGAGTAIAVQVDARYQREDWRSAVRRLGPVPPGGRAIIVVPGSGRIAVQHYLPRARESPRPETKFVDAFDVLQAGAGPDGQVLATSGEAAPPDLRDAVILLERP